jgi:AraC family L-rhamnose operon transcriptional activator RhaR
VHKVLREDVFVDTGPAVLVQQFCLAEDVSVHGHGFIEIAVVTGGTARHVSASGSAPLRRGSVVVQRPGDWHGYVDVADLSVLNVYAGPELFALELEWVAKDPALGAVLRPHRDGRSARSPATHLEDKALARVEDWCAALMATGVGDVGFEGRSARALRLGHLILLLGEVGGAMSGQGQGADVRARAHPAVSEAMHLLASDLAEPWSVPRLAGAANLAPAYLTRLFSAEVGLAPMAYVNRLRAERAAALLIETDLPVASIGALVGWPDPSYASRRFRACFALSPAQYRAAFRPPRRP